MERRLFIIETTLDLERCFLVIKELRPHLNLNDYLAIYKQAHKSDGYELAVIEENGNILAAMGYRILYDFVRGKHIYIDDLVSTEKARSKGLGAELLSYAEKIANESNCNSLRLCAGVENVRGMKFYERNGWIQRAVAYTKKIKP
jgi:GNAT superfamily N-acetyltransferase